MMAAYESAIASYASCGSEGFMARSFPAGDRGSRGFLRPGPPERGGPGIERREQDHLHGDEDDRRSFAGPHGSGEDVPKRDGHAADPVDIQNRDDREIPERVEARQ